MTDILSLYIHIPFCISKCKYCDFFSIPCGNKSGNKIVPDSYIKSLCNEIKFRLNFYNVQKLETIYIGGGTPSLLAQDQLQLIFETITSVLTGFDDNKCEITIEANPDDITSTLLNSWKNVGINRISLGIQSFNDCALSYVSRRASAKVNKEALERIVGQWSGQISVDLICGLPGQSKESFQKDLEYLVSIKPDHISMYSLTIEDETPLGKEFNNGKLHYDFDFADELWLFSKEYLKQNGYEHYEVSNFSLPGKNCKHNLKYWNHESYLGVGSGGAGTVYNDDGSGYRWTNLKNIKKYTDFWENQESVFVSKNKSEVEESEEISLETSKFEFFMMGMRKLEGIKSSDYKKIFNSPIPERIVKTFHKWEQEGLCIIENDLISPGEQKITLGHKGIIYLNKFLEEII